ncbi:hypothetical protein KUCAC02_018142, partial [Chaenocephalus aceratus]
GSQEQWVSAGAAPCPILGQGRTGEQSILLNVLILGFCFGPYKIAAEFTRFVAADLPKSFLSGLDRHLPRLLELYKARERRDRTIHSLLESLDSE